MNTNGEATMPRLLRFVQIAIGLLLVVAAFSKTQSIPMFAFVLQQSIPFLHGVSSEGLFRVVHGIVLTEVMLGLCLIVRVCDVTVRWLTVMLFLVFSGVLASMLMRDQPLSCGCLGVAPSGLGTRAQLFFGLARNGFLIGLLVLISTHMSRQTKDLHEEQADD